MAQKLSDLHGVEIKFNTTPPIIVYNSIKMRIMLELLTEDVRFQLLFILFLLFLYSVKYRFNQMCPMNTLVEKG